MLLLFKKNLIGTELKRIPYSSDFFFLFLFHNPLFFLDSSYVIAKLDLITGDRLGG